MNRLLIAVLIVVGAARAHADDATPWTKGVPQAQQDKANGLFAEANQLFAQQAHAPALEKYRAAIALWDHPMIRFNMAVTLIRLNQILEASDALEAALRFGNKPFTAELYQQALDYQGLLKRQVGNVSASCTQSGTSVILDSKPWFQCPGQKQERVLAGEHVIVGERKDYMTSSKHVIVAGGVTTTQKIELVPIGVGTTVKYPYARWLPFTTLGVGVAVGLGGVAFWFAGRNQMDKFQADFAQACPTGCEADLSMHSLLADERDSAKLKGKIAISMMVAGGAVAVTGAVWAIINARGKQIIPIEITPTPGGGMGASYSGRF